MNTHIADRIAQNLGNLQHPGTTTTGPTPIPLPMFRESAITPDMREHFANEVGLPTPDIATLVAEAIVTLIETTHTIIPNTDITTMRQALTAAEPARDKRINLTCRCGTPLFTADVTAFDTENPTIYAPPVITYLQNLSPECALGHKAT